jgi:UDP:flavonoid glycosyltransferase YjiC (YdhE family)
MGDPIRRLRRDLGLRPAPPDPILAGQLSPYLNLALFSPIFAAPQPDWPPATVATGFAFYDKGGVDYEHLDPGIQAFLAAGPPPIAFTLGSAIVRSPRRFFHETFDLLRTLDVRAVVVTGADPGNQPAQPLPQRVLAVPYAPYGELFHRAAAIVHHGGIGTTAQALRSGRPQLVVAHAHDQPDNGARVARLGAGLTIPFHRYTALRAASLLRTLLAENSFARRAAEVGTTIGSERGSCAAADAIESLFRRINSA